MFAPATRFARRTSQVLASRDNQPLTIDQVRAHAPSVFATAPHESRSQRYIQIPTSFVLEGLMANGFKPYSVTQARSRIEGKTPFTKHLIRMRPDGFQRPAVLNEEYPEIILINSHDGTSSYQLAGGMFRLVCLNGMVVATDKFEDIRVKHSGDGEKIRGEVIDAAFKVMDRFGNVIEQVGEWKDLRLTYDEQLLLGQAALELRYPNAEAEIPIDAHQVVAARRPEDRPNTLWHTFQRIQEHTVRGGLEGSVAIENSRQRRRVTTRPVEGIDGNTALNRGLWTLMAGMADLKAGRPVGGVAPTAANQGADLLVA